jgi:broad-specificity NMP kinase
VGPHCPTYFLLFLILADLIAKHLVRSVAHHIALVVLEHLILLPPDHVVVLVDVKAVLLGHLGAHHVPEEIVLEDVEAHVVEVVLGHVLVNVVEDAMVVVPDVGDRAVKDVAVIVLLLVRPQD